MTKKTVKWTNKKNIQLTMVVASVLIRSLSARLCIGRFLRSMPWHATPMLSKASQPLFTNT